MNMTENPTNHPLGVASTPVAFAADRPQPQTGAAAQASRGLCSGEGGPCSNVQAARPLPVPFSISRARARLSAWAALLCATIVAIVLGGCSLLGSRAASLRVAGASDVLPAATAVEEAYTRTTGLQMALLPSTDAVASLKAGKVDVALLGKEPAPADLAGLEDHVIAYDAVCFLVNTRTYRGGEQEQLGPGGLMVPVEKTSGLSGLDSDEVKRIYQMNLLRETHDYDFWDYAFRF